MSKEHELSGIARIFAHDLNNLLAVMTGYFDLAMLEMEGFPETIQEGLPIARQCASEAGSLVSDFYDMIAMEAKRLVLNREKTDMRGLVSGIIKKDALPKAKGAGVTLVWLDEGGPLFCDVDKRLISKAASNLITAAIRGTSEGGRVEVSAGRAGNSVTITVKDTGLPVPPEYREKIFKKDSLEEVSKTTLKKRAGLELIFSALAVKAHGGGVRVESEGKKNVFIITIPKQ